MANTQKSSLVILRTQVYVSQLSQTVSNLISPALFLQHNILFPLMISQYHVPFWHIWASICPYINFTTHMKHSICTFSFPWQLGGVGDVCMQPLGRFLSRFYSGNLWVFLAVFMVIEYRTVYKQRTVHLHNYLCALLEVQLCKFPFLSYVNYVDSKRGKMDRGRLCSFPIIACLCGHVNFGVKNLRGSVHSCDSVIVAGRFAKLSWSNKADVVMSLS